MNKILVFTVILLFALPSNAVTVSCIDEGNNIVRIEYDATGESSLPKAFALDVTVNNGAIIKQVTNYKTGDSTAASPGYGIFPHSISYNIAGEITDWGSPDIKNSLSGTLPGVGTSGVTLIMASRYSGSNNAPTVRGTLCKITIDPGNAEIVNFKVAANIKAAGVVLENSKSANFNGVNCILYPSSVPPDPDPNPVPVEVIVDNLDSTTSSSSTWFVSSGPGPWSTNSVFTNIVGGTFTFKANLVPGTKYAVYEWHTYYSNRITSVPHQILDNGSLLGTVNVNQRDSNNDGQWNLLGTYTFTNGSASVVISRPANTGGIESGDTSCADAIRFVPID